MVTYKDWALQQFDCQFGRKEEGEDRHVNGVMQMLQISIWDALPAPEYRHSQTYKPCSPNYFISLFNGSALFGF